MTSYFKTLIVTHLSCFIGGVLVGKTIDADELAAYRYSSRSSSSSSESILEWAKRIVIFGSSIVGGAVIIFGIGRLSAGMGKGGSTGSRKSLE